MALQSPALYCRFIPAYTGNSPAGPRGSRPVSVHPRVHGELLSDLGGRERPVGSSPRTRGTRQRDSRFAPVRRFIPAYTGNSRPTRAAGSPRPVHPRVHGELSCQVTVPECSTGSSPRTRGTLGDCLYWFLITRFIPAYTGNSHGRPARGYRRAVHPRVHGELYEWAKDEILNVGSSPRTRGTHPAAGDRVQRQRFIPAYTGNSYDKMTEK